MSSSGASPIAEIAQATRTHDLILLGRLTEPGRNRHEAPEDDGHISEREDWHVAGAGVSRVRAMAPTLVVLADRTWCCDFARR